MGRTVSLSIEGLAPGQERAPIAADLKRAMHEKSKTGQKTFALSADVSEAHRQVPIAECDWYLLGCQVQLGSAVYVNKVGTFGVASASYHWSRVASALCRLAQYLVRHASHTWHFLLEASGPCYRAALVVFFLLCSSLNVPLSWNMTAGGDTVTWVGFELLLHSHQLGISLGRIVYVADALEFERPFVGPLFKFLMNHPRGSARRVPSYVPFILQYLSHQVERSRHYPCASEMVSSEVAPRVDAQASGERTGIGWLVPSVGGRRTARSKEIAMVHL